MQNIIKRNSLAAQKVIKAFESRNFNAFYAQNKNEAVKKILELISGNETISWGGSVTLDEIGIKDYLENNSYNIIDRDKAKSDKEKEELILKSITADIFLMSSNAVTKDGELVNIDGHGNRLAALCYGPKKVIVVAGINKIAESLDEAVSRARNYSAPVNAQRVSNFFEMHTPCIASGYCADCKSQTSICSQILITRLSYPKGRINVILVNENLGY